MRILPAGDAAVLVELADLAEAGRLYASLRADPPPGTLDLVPATRTVLVTLDRAVTGAEQVAAALRSRSPADAPDPGRGELVELPTRYDGPDLADVAALTGLADEFSGAYPRRMPGGWQLIGRTDAVLWDLDRDPPALLPPGTRVRFVPA